MKGIVVNRLRERFIKLCWDWIAEHHANKNQLAREVGTKPPRVSDLLNKKTNLTMYYIKLFILGGVFSVEQIYDGKPESKEEAMAWAKLKLFNNDRVMDALVTALDSNVTEDQLIEFLLSNAAKDGE
jgi:hypothetical protein